MWQRPRTPPSRDGVVSGTFNYMDDPDLFLERYTTGDSSNWGRFSDPRIDDLFARQTRALDPSERKRLVNEIEKIVLENAYDIPGLCGGRTVVHRGEGEELRLAAQPFFEPEASGRLAQRGLRS